MLPHVLLVAALPAALPSRAPNACRTTPAPCLPICHSRLAGVVWWRRLAPASVPASQVQPLEHSGQRLVRRSSGLLGLAAPVPYAVPAAGWRHLRRPVGAAILCCKARVKVAPIRGQEFVCMFAAAAQPRLMADRHEVKLGGEAERQCRQQRHRHPRHAKQAEPARHLVAPRGTASVPGCNDAPQGA